MSEAILGATRNKLMKDKLGSHFQWTPPNIENRVGPYNPDVFKRYEEERQRVVAICEEKLAGWCDLDILTLGDAEFDAPDDISSEWHSFQRDEIDRLEKMQPPWFAGGFGHPEYIADFEYWARIPYFTNDEALLLSLGVEPLSFTQDQIIDMQVSLEKGTNLFEPLRYLLRRRDQIERQFPTFVHPNHVDPKPLFDWFRLVDLEIHPDFTSRYLENTKDVAPNAETNATSKPDKREIDSVCQLFAAVAIDCYGYDPGAKRSPIPKEIAELAANLGLELSEDTIRKYLRRGASFISNGWKPK